MNELLKHMQMLLLFCTERNFREIRKREQKGESVALLYRVGQKSRHI